MVLRYVLRLCRIIRHHIRLSILALHLIFGITIWMIVIEGCGTNYPNRDKDISTPYLPPLFTPLQVYLESSRR